MALPNVDICDSLGKDAVPSRYRSSSTLMLQTCSNTSKGTRNWTPKPPT